jgi:HSP20 family protein
MTAELAGMLTLKGEKKQEKEQKEPKEKSERSYGSFQRGFYVPEGVDRDKIAADFSKGVLTITTPKNGCLMQPP